MEGASDVARPDGDTEPPDTLLQERSTLCISIPQPGTVLQRGNAGFKQELDKWYAATESNAAEALVLLKARLRQAKPDEFWATLSEGMAKLVDAQYGFVSKRILANNQDSSVEIPPYGAPGSCLMAQTWYYNDEKGTEGNQPGVKYIVYGCPCEHMRHDKVLVIPERLNEVVVDNPNKAAFVVPAEAYLAIPLWQDGKCFAHFGVMWSAAGIKRRRLSWAYMEIMMHALEDMVVAAFERSNFAKLAQTQSFGPVIPHEVVTAAQSLKPYARSLSHELRTPMQGVVGMLDVMYATVQEASEGATDPGMRAVFRLLKENIEVVQDSSRRAVEAADNVVYAYDMNMGVPEMPISPPEKEPWGKRHLEKRPDIVVTGDNVPINFKSVKRRRLSESHCYKPSKQRRTLEPSPNRINGRCKGEPYPASDFGDDYSRGIPDGTSSMDMLSAKHGILPPGLRHTNIRDLLQYLVNDSLKVGGRPDSAIARETEGGELIEVMVARPNGEVKIKMIEWSVDPGVPETILIDEQDLARVITGVFLNALKFTEEGRIVLTVRLSPRSRFIVINIRDSGPGIPESFLPNLFKPFSKEDDSLTRVTEGLGLGLYVAKGLAHKLGGQLKCVRSDTTGPHRGSEFEMRVPTSPFDIPSSPFASPSPRSRSATRVPTEPMHRSSASRDSISSTDIPTPRSRRTALAQTRKRGRSTLTSSRRRSPSPLDGKVPTPAAGAKRGEAFDRKLAARYPLTFLVVEDNKINRRLLVSMLAKLGYASVHEAYDGADAVRVMQSPRGRDVDVVLMDLWMPFMDGYEASERILGMAPAGPGGSGSEEEEVEAEGQIAEGEAGGEQATWNPRWKARPTILAVTADVTDEALKRAAKAGMRGFLTKPYKLHDLERLIVQYCATRSAGPEATVAEEAEGMEVEEEL
ncbi:hypothetical protein EJ06DRAFT_535426 [Trichodelitschia bisporula]|uniref:histidine kinase n=1 Tax=Trichodelitschia bisporula TaxID=703511 RepID=A0A6G1IBN1_9PEZI|nr:hypothetical protein EJ06DRAFT_535426 [Trichodelitschia bisporula]